MSRKVEVRDRGQITLVAKPAQTENNSIGIRNKRKGQRNLVENKEGEAVARGKNIVPVVIVEVKAALNQIPP